MEHQQLRRVQLFGLPVDIINDHNFEQAITKLQVSTKQEQIKFLSYREFVNTIFSRDKKARLKSCALIVPTSLRLNRAVNFVHKSKSKLFTQFNFVIKLMGFIEAQKGSVYIISGKNKDTLTSESNLKTSFPGIRFVGRFSGSFKKAQEKNLIEAVRKASPSLLLTGEGSRVKDKWLYRNKQMLSNGICLHSKESFQIFTGKRSSKSSPFIKQITSPLMIFDILSMLWFYPLLITERIKSKK